VGRRVNLLPFIFYAGGILLCSSLIGGSLLYATSASLNMTVSLVDTRTNQRVTTTNYGFAAGQIQPSILVLPEINMTMDQGSFSPILDHRSFGYATCEEWLTHLKSQQSDLLSGHLFQIMFSDPSGLFQLYNHDQEILFDTWISCQNNLIKETRPFQIRFKPATHLSGRYQLGYQLGGYINQVGRINLHIRSQLEMELESLNVSSVDASLASLGVSDSDIDSDFFKLIEFNQPNSMDEMMVFMRRLDANHRSFSKGEFYHPCQFIIADAQRILKKSESDFLLLEKEKNIYLNKKAQKRIKGYRDHYRRLFVELEQCAEKSAQKESVLFAFLEEGDAMVTELKMVELNADILSLSKSYNDYQLQVGNDLDHVVALVLAEINAEVFSRKSSVSDISVSNLDLKLFELFPLKTFGDVTNSTPFYRDILLLSSMGVMGGDQDGNFNPNQSVTRGYLAYLIALMANLDVTTSSLELTYADVANTHPYFKYIMSVINEGYMVAFFDGTFRPDQVVNLSEIVTTLSESGLIEVTDVSDTGVTRAELASFLSTTDPYELELDAFIRRLLENVSVYSMEKLYHSKKQLFILGQGLQYSRDRLALFTQNYSRIYTVVEALHLFFGQLQYTQVVLNDLIGTLKSLDSNYMVLEYEFQKDSLQALFDDIQKADQLLKDLNNTPEQE